MRPRETIAPLALATAVLLASCGHRELKAPCGPDEGGPSAIPSTVTSLVPVEDHLSGPRLNGTPRSTMPLTGSPLDRLAAASGLDPCGPLRPLNAAK
jgi:hypothetical protein